MCNVIPTIQLCKNETIVVHPDGHAQSFYGQVDGVSAQTALLDTLQVTFLTAVSSLSISIRMQLFMYPVLGPEIRRFARPPGCAADQAAALPVHRHVALNAPQWNRPRMNITE
jgi:hypothetical protein